MYQVIIKGRSLIELKKAVEDIHNELNAGGTIVHNLEKSLEEISAPIMEENKQRAESEFAPINLNDVAPDNLIPSIVPVLPPVGAAPIIPNLTPAPLMSGAELDTEGIPWDKRIHASSKNKLKDGTWRLKRGIEADVVAQFKQELRTNVQLAANPTPIPTIPPSVPVEVTPAIAIQPVTTPPVAPTSLPVNPQLTSGHTFETFSNQFAMILGSLINEKKITQDYVNQIKEYFKVDQIWNVSEAQKLEMFNNFVNSGFIQKVA